MARLGDVLRGCLPGQPERLLALDAAIRAPLPLSTRIGVLGGDPAAPTALVAGLLAATLAGRRPHRVLAVAARQGPRPARPAGAESAPTGLDDAAIARRATARTGAEATDGLAQLPGGAWTLDLAGQAERWWDAVAPISRFFDFVVTDWGTPATLDDVRGTGGVLLVVGTGTPEALRAGAELRARLAGPDADALFAPVDGGGAHRGLAEAARVNDACWLPFDRALASGRREPEPPGPPGQPDREQPGPGALARRAADVLGPPTRRLRYPSATAVLELAARVVTAAAPTPPTRTEVPA